LRTRVAATTAALLLLGPLAATAQGETQPIAGDPGWEMTRVDGGGCFARLAGAQVDTILTVNNSGVMALSAGHQEWKLGPGPERTISLGIDGAAPHAVQAIPVANFYMVLVSDPVLLKAVRLAHRLTWTTPQGRFSAKVSNIGETFDLVRACGLPPPGG
jgi:hypothetical protein